MVYRCPINSVAIFVSLILAMIFIANCSKNQSETTIPLRCSLGESQIGLGRKTSHCEIDIPFASDIVFNQLGPIEQSQWLAKQPNQYICPNNVRSENECVFSFNAEDHTATWFISRFEPENSFIQFLIFHPGLFIERQDITVSSRGTNRSRVRWTRTFTALDSEGQNILADLTEEQLINHASETVDGLRNFLEHNESLGETSGMVERNNFTSSRIHEEVAHEIDFPAEDVFPLLCPVLEYEWLDGWECTMIYSESEIAEDNCVFTTQEFGMLGIWAITRFEPEAGLITYHLLYPEAGIMRIVDASVVDGNNGTSVLQWRISLIGLSEEGNSFIDFVVTPDYLESEFEYSKNAINHYLATGEMLLRQ